MNFTFQTDEESKLFSERVVEAMRLLYDLRAEEGLDRLNEVWQGRDLRDLANGGTERFAWLIYHELEAHWASEFCNPNPYMPGPEYDEWVARDTEAEKRIEEFRAAGIHKWLYY